MVPNDDKGRIGDEFEAKDELEPGDIEGFPNEDCDWEPLYVEDAADGDDDTELNVEGELMLEDDVPNDDWPPL